MGNSSRSGFTIIETVLFLAVSGLLILTIVGGAGVNINVQRYHDAVESFKSQLQAQYAALTDVQNSRSADKLCGSDAKPVDASNGQARGQSDCMVVGRYVRVEDENVAVYTVLGYETSKVVAPNSNDIEIMKTNYVYNTAGIPDDENSLPWGTAIALPKGSVGPRQLGILFLRSPVSGQTYTFTSNAVPIKSAVTNDTLQEMIVDANAIPGRGESTICMESNGLFIDDSQSITVRHNASGPTSIEVTTNQVLSKTGGAQC